MTELADSGGASQLSRLYKTHLQLKRAMFSPIASRLRDNKATAEDYARLTYDAHKLKGSGKSYGWPALSAAAERLERALRTENTNAETLNALLLGLVDAMDLAIAAEAPPLAFKAEMETKRRLAPYRRRAGYQPLILVVDDDPTILEVVKAALVDRARVNIVESGMDALAALRAVRYDLVILDQHMPHISGLDVLKNGRLSVDGVDTPVVMLSADRDAARVSILRQAGACGYIAKPFNLKGLIDDIDTILGGEAPIALVADDDPLVRELISHRLRQVGATVLFASTCADALKIARHARPHLMILDRNMPGGDGLDVLSLLRRESSTASMAVVLLSAYNSDADISDGYARDADDYVTKPFAPHDLVHRCIDFLNPVH